jgi:hypothetical protein
MIERNIIREGRAEEYLLMYDNSMNQLEKNGEIQETEEIKHYNGYSVKVKSWEFSGNFESK